MAYDFSAGMVCLIDTGVVLNPSGGNATISYSFSNLPGRAVFSVYGFVSTDTPASIYHTNRAVTDNNDPSALLSTFEVIPEPSSLLMMLSVGGLLTLRRRCSVERGG